jgi:Zn-finger nucleic acid-binding protein
VLRAIHAEQIEARRADDWRHGMNCPACGRELSRLVVGGITVDACNGGCGGVWFDQGELKHFDKPGDEPSRALLEVPKDPSVRVDPSARRRCPRDTDVVMMRHYWSPKHAVSVDECPQCGGYWLDQGELAALRAEYPSEQAREAAGDAEFEALFGAAVDQAHAKDAEELARAQRVANMLKFLCPSYYLPGKQDGAAF